MSLRGISNPAHATQADLRWQRIRINHTYDPLGQLYQFPPTRAAERVRSQNREVEPALEFSALAGRGIPGDERGYA